MERIRIADTIKKAICKLLGWFDLFSGFFEILFFDFLAAICSS
jgi:hypothetical protein